MLRNRNFFFIKMRGKEGVFCVKEVDFFINIFLILVVIYICWGGYLFEY